MSRAWSDTDNPDSLLLDVTARLMASLAPASDPESALQTALAELETLTGLELAISTNLQASTFTLEIRPSGESQCSPAQQAALEVGERILFYRLQELRAQEQMQALLEIAAGNENWQSPWDLLEQTGKFLLEATGFEACLLHLPDPDAKGAFRMAKILAGRVPAPALEQLLIDRDFPEGPGLVGEALRRKTAVYSADYSTYPNPYPGYLELGLRSVALVPISQGNQVAGLIELQSYHKTPAQNPLMFLQMVSHHLEAALNRVAHSQALSNSVQTYRELAEFSARLEAIHDPEALIEEAFATVLHLTGFNSANYMMILPDGSAKRHRFLALAGSPESRPELAEFFDRPFAPGTGGTGEALKQKQTIFHPDYAGFPGALPDYLKLGLTSLATSPVVAGGKAVGLLQLRHYGPETQPDPSPLLSFVATRLGNALDQEAAMESLAKEAERFAALAELSAKLEKIDSASEIARMGGETLVKLTAFEFGAMYVRQGEIFAAETFFGKVPLDFPELARQNPLNHDEIVPAVTGSGPGQPGWIIDFQRFGIRPYAQGGLLSVVNIPIYTRGELLGALYLATTRQIIEADADTTSLLQAVGGRIERALERSDFLAATLQSQREAEAESRRFLALAELSARLEGLSSPQEIAAEGLEALLKLTRFESGSYFEADQTGEWFRMAEGRGNAPDGTAELLESWAMPRREILFNNTLGPGQVGWISDYDQVGISPLRETGLKTLAAIPLYAQDQLLGGLFLSSFTRSLARETVTEKLMHTVAARIERALERALDFQNIKSTREESLRLLGIALELRDLETAGHTNRVAQLALQVGHRVLGSESELEELRWGSYLHDTGKMAIPDSILLKPGRFTPEEFRVMQTHAAVGEQMLRPLGFLPSATLWVVRHHHERWDGGGYPDGLSGDSIPLLARIFTLADVYDALTHVRPYKPAWSVEAARAEIAAQAGKQFDPELARIFLELHSSD